MKIPAHLYMKNKTISIVLGLMIGAVLANAAPTEEGFQSLFDGQSLKGWRAADLSYWSVEDGAITARITTEHPLKSNLYLIWEGGGLADFELKLKHRVFGSKGINCGFQFRSRELPNHDIAGYQVDNNLDTDWLVRLYDEHGRETLAWRGQRTMFDENGKATHENIEEGQGPAWFKLEEWHEYDLLCVGSRLTLRVDGRLAAEVIDNDPVNQDFSGILGLQLHTGPPTVAQFKDIRLKILHQAQASPVQGKALVPRVLRDKTLVAWVAPSNLDQRGGSTLTIDDGQSHFDGIVFGELSPGKWMAGSDNFKRTWQDQANWKAERTSPDSFVQIAISYASKDVKMYRNGEAYASYTMPNPPQDFPAESIVLFGRRHLDVTEPRSSFAGRIQDARIYDRALDQATIKSLVAGRPGAEPKPWAWWSFGDEGLREKTGRFNELKLLGDVRIDNGCLVLGGKGATVIASASGADGTQVRVPKEWSVTSSVPEEVVRSSRLLRERFLADPYRPRYHFCVPEDMGEPGDPNGAFYHDGRYHLMYLYNRSGVGFCWGHISSSDLLHWRHHPDAIGPGHGDEGCFSGGAFVDEDGSAWLSYWMLWGSRGIGLARSSDPHFDIWSKLNANPVIKSTEWGITEINDAQGKPLFVGSADPSNIWKKNGKYYMLTGNLLVLNKVGRAPDAPEECQGDRLYLFESQDLKTWKYRYVFYERRAEWTDRSEDNMCPSFLALPGKSDGGLASDKHLLLFISHNKGCQYYIGSYRNDRFFPENHGRMTWIDNTYFAPEALIDGKGRQIMWAWLTDNPGGDKAKGWSGVYGLPRSLWLGEDGTLRMAPVKELESLRQHEHSWGSVSLAAGESKLLDPVSGDACELDLDIEPEAASSCGLKVRASPDGEEETLLYYNAGARELVFDSTRSGAKGRKVVERAPLQLNPNEPLKLRVFVDTSVVEVYANDRQAICRRVYPLRSDSLRVSLFARGAGAKFTRVQAWEMSPSNPF
jgi:beta-fructofuranosidase